MDKCIFCEILAGRLEGSFVHRGAHCSAFLDLYPVNPGHVLVIPNAHFERFIDIPKLELTEMVHLAQSILRAIQKTDLRCEGANLFLSDGEVAGQEVPHSHLHIAPRFNGDRHKVGFSHSDSDKVARERLNLLASEISNNLENP